MKKRKEINYELLEVIKWTRETVDTAIRQGDLNPERDSSIDAHFTHRSTLQLRRLVNAKDPKSKRDAFNVLRAYSIVEQELKG